ncbi:MAG: futalosine hydrolase [Sumerlaeia bacterium]
MTNKYSKNQSLSAEPLDGWIVVFATEFEKSGVVACLEFGAVSFSKGCVVTGIGGLNSAVSLVQFLEHQTPTGVLNIGLAGASNSASLEISRLVLAEEEWFADLGVRTEDDDFGLEEIGFPLVKDQAKPWNRVGIDEANTTEFAKCLSVPKRPFITVNQCSGSLGVAQKRESKFPACVENMEGATLAAVCNRYGVPFVELRAISNLMGNRDKSAWDFKNSFQNLAHAVQALVQVEMLFFSEKQIHERN